jgi:ectoine hydroxylase-related dioxygenase (phytanoyl-CoA dioxygenase family)
MSSSTFATRRRTTWSATSANDPGDPVNVPAGSIACFSSTLFHRSGANTTDRMRRVYLAQHSAEPILNGDGRPRHLAEPL